MPVRQCTGGGSGGSCESINRKREPHHGRRAAPAGSLLGLVALLAACTQGPAAAASPRQRPGPRSGHGRFPDLLHPPPDPRGPGRRHARAAVRRGRRLQRHPVEARSRQPGRPGNRDHRPPAHRGRWAASRRPLRHQGPRRLARRPQGGLRHARPAGRLRRGRAADLEHLGIRHRDRHAASRDQLGHHRGGRPGRRAGLSTRRPHPVLLDAPAPVQGHPARREQGAVRGRQRGRATNPRSCCTS